jgi:hypothetical protein
LEVVAVQGDVELAAGETGAFGCIDQPLQSAGEFDTATLNTDEDEILGAAAPLNDLTGHTREGPAECALVQERRAGGHRGGKLVGAAERRKGGEAVRR